MKFRITLFIIALLMVLASCQKDVPTAPIKAGSVRDFPNTLGSSWVYHVTDNLQKIDSTKPYTKIDTVTATITGYATDPITGLNATIWTYLQNSRNITEKLAVISGDTVYFYWNYLSNDKIGLIFPFDYRDSWQTGGILVGDKTTVIDTIALRTPTGLYPRVYVLKNERRTSIETDTRIMTLWFVPNLGIVRIHSHEEHAQSEGDTTWIMVDHNNPNF